ncbi:hypothetical protein NDA16_000337 [Ustilago loliicola]|nr:hypothetical protein NDA16_000337 [Ustilago loliicola]
MQPHSNGIAQKPHPALAASPAPAHSASSPTDDRVTSATASEFDSSIPNDARGSFLSSTEPVNYESLLGDKQKFTPVSVVSCLALSEEEMDDLIIDHVEEQGLPLVISDLHKTAAWSSDSFSLDKYRHLAPNRGPKGEETGARNLTVGQKRSISVPDFLAHCNNVKEYLPDQPEKFYGDELPCPAAWKQALGALVHPRLQYHGEQDVSSSLSPDARSVSLACRFGPGRTCLPLQRGLCSSLGQDLMVWSDPGASSIWMIANPEDAEAVDQYISSNGGDPQTETFSPHPKELVDASFPIFCCEQKLGDLVLVPSRATHMVINTGGWTMKMAWSRMTIDTLSSALFADLPLYQRYCRPEKLHVKSMIEETLIKYTKKIESHADTALERMPEVIRDLRKLLKMYDAIIADEYVPEWRDIVREGGNDSYVECDFCGADVLHGYFECLAGETLCTLCYCQGRLCGCPDAAESLKPRQHWRTFGERLQMRNEAAQILLKVKPDLALLTGPVTDDEEDDEDDEPAPWPVRLLKEEHVEEQGWALGFLAAFRLYSLRQTSGWQSNMGTCRLCKAVLDLSQRYYCKPCRHSYCHGCLLHRLKIHPVHTLAQKDPDKFHKYHRKESSLDYKEWKHDPLVYKVEAQVNFALIEAARTKMKCMPINEKCRIGFLDVTTEHPNGLSGTLGCKKPRKNAKDKAKVSAAPSSVSATSTPVSRKRQSDVFQAPSSASPRDPTGKRARLDSPPDVEPMDEDEIALLKPHKQAVKSVRLDVAPTTSPTGISRTVTNRSIAPLTPGDNGVNLSVPTVESGIRKFVLRAGKATLVSPASPTASVASSATSQSSSVAPAAPNAKGSFTKPIAETTSKSPLTAAQPPSHAAPATNPSTGSAPSSSSAPIVAQGLVAASAPTAAAARATAPTMEVALLAAPARATAATVPSPKQPAVVPSAHVSRPEGTVPAIVAQTVERGNAGPETLAAATNAAAAGNSTGSTRPVATTIDAAGTILSTLDTTNLRIITEVVRIFYDDTKRLLAVEAEKNRKVQAEQAEELTQMRRELKEMKELLATQEEKRKESEAKQTGVMAQISHKLDVVMQQMHSKDERVEEKVERVHEMFRGLMEDIDRGARAQLEGEESMQAAEATVIESSSSSASSASGDNAQQPR